ncbi:MAG TPA: glycosyltransferase family 4 protein [bacterium]|nr:glycosyltransferase family 4 protein [bacterium]
MRIGFLIPHLFAQNKILDETIFAPVTLARNLIEELSNLGAHVTLYTPFPLDSSATENINIKTDSLEKELNLNKCTLEELIVENPLAFVSIARQINTEITAKAFTDANENRIDILHVYLTEDETPLYFADLIQKPLLFTNHDPYNFYRKYRVRFPHLKNLKYISISKFQQSTAPKNLNFVANIYNGVKIDDYPFNDKPNDYFCTIGRIIKNKGVHHAIEAVRESNEKLRIAGKYYSDEKDPEENYWAKYIAPEIDNKSIYYEGFLKPPHETAQFLGNAKALLFPIEWAEPFGMVMIESMACGTPVIAFDCGPVREIIKDGVTGFIVKNSKEMSEAMRRIESINRKACRDHVIKNFSVKRMAKEHLDLYRKIYQY